ncbi:MAG: tetratricopeptide repeat protein, partial [Myxococcaceae bacterium]|nr:tetratricopeptide repeat protein [Myxococcaceae bacterium]
DGRVRVSDFGLAHDVDVAEAAAGTAHYMAPEVLAGKAATAAADQYAFCLVLREALSGEGPVALRQIIERGLERDPSSRHPSMAALVAELERVVRPKTAAWAAAAVAAVLVPVAGYATFVRGSAQPCSAGPGLVAAVWNAERKGALKAVAPPAEAATAARVFDRLDTFALRWADAHQRACEATRVSGEQSEQLMDLKMACLQQSLRGVDATLAALEQQPAAFAKSIEAVDELLSLGRCSDPGFLTAAGGTKLTAEQRSRVAALREEGAATRQLLVLGLYEKGRAAAEQGLTAARASGVKAVEGEAELLAAEFARKLRSTMEQGADLDRRIEAAVLAGTEAQYPHLLADVWLLKMRVCTDDARFDEADRAEANLAANLRAIGADPSLQVRHELALGRLRFRQEKLDAAYAAYAACEAQLGALPADERRLAAGQLYGGLALVQLVRGDLEPGMQSLRQAITHTEEHFGPESHRLGDLLHNLAEVELARGQLEQATAHVNRAGAVWARAFGDDYPRVGVNLNLTALILAAAGRGDDALAAVERAKAIFTKHRLDKQFLFMRSLCAEGDVRLARGEVDEALTALRAAVELAPKVAGKYPQDEAACWRGLGEALVAGGQGAEARDALKRSLALYGSTGPWRARSVLALAQLDRDRAGLEDVVATLERYGLDPKLHARAKAALGDAAPRLGR